MGADPVPQNDVARFCRAGGATGAVPSRVGNALFTPHVRDCDRPHIGGRSMITGLKCDVYHQQTSFPGR